MTDELKPGMAVSAHRLDRFGTVVVGELMPYDDNQGERVKDAYGVIWCVVADSVRPLPADEDWEQTLADIAEVDEKRTF